MAYLPINYAQAVTEGHRQRVADVERNKHEWVGDTSLADGRLLRKRVAAAKARRGYDKAWKKLRRTETRMAKAGVVVANRMSSRKL